MVELLNDIGLLVIGAGLLVAVVSIFSHLPKRRGPARPGHKKP